jgi:hypothetical protein
MIEREGYMLNWNDLTNEERDQTEISYLSILEDIAVKGDVHDKVDYEMKKEHRELRLSALQCKSFIRDKDGYIFVNM